MGMGSWRMGQGMIKRTSCAPLCSHFMLRRNPANDQNASNVSVMKSDIIDRSDTNSMFSDMTLKASLGMRMGAATLRTSRAVRATSNDSCSSSILNAWMRRIR